MMLRFCSLTFHVVMQFVNRSNIVSFPEVRIMALPSRIESNGMLQFFFQIKSRFAFRACKSVNIISPRIAELMTVR